MRIHTNVIGMSQFQAMAVKELEQEKLLLIEINNLLTEQINMLQKELPAPDRIKEMEQENIVLTEITKQLEEKEVKLDDFFPNISHELRTRLVPVQAYLEMLLLGKFGRVNEIQAQKLDIVKNNVLSLNQFVVNVLDSIKIEFGELVILKKDNDLGKIIRDAITIMRPYADQINTKLVFRNTSLFVPCDEKRILNVLTNLIQNSLNAINAHEGKIEISVSENNDVVSISVEDNGKGITEEHLSKIFDKFHKTERGLTQGGLGIGLYFCKQIVNIHGGKILAYSKIGNGTTIHFTLPKSY